MANRFGPIQFPASVQLTMAGIPAVYLTIDPESCPNGFEVAVTRPGDLAPFNRGLVPAGCGILLLPPDVHQSLRAGFAQAIETARQEASRNGQGGN
jgi:hypothetical protein